MAFKTWTVLVSIVLVSIVVTFPTFAFRLKYGHQLKDQDDTIPIKFRNQSNIFKDHPVFLHHKRDFSERQIEKPKIVPTAVPSPKITVTKPKDESRKVVVRPKSSVIDEKKEDTAVKVDAVIKAGDTVVKPVQINPQKDTKDTKKITTTVPTAKVPAVSTAPTNANLKQTTDDKPLENIPKKSPATKPLIEKVVAEKFDVKPAKAVPEKKITEQPPKLPVKTANNATKAVVKDEKKVPVSKVKEPRKTVVLEKKVKSEPKKPVRHDKNQLQDRSQRQRFFDRLYYSFPSFAPNYTRIVNPECKLQGQIFLRQLKAAKLWTLKMLDSTAKVSSGILQGNLNQLGDYDQCIGLNTKIILNEKRKQFVHIQGKYCLVHIDIEAKSTTMTLPVNLAQARSFVKSTYNDPGHFIPRFTTMRWGLCLPDACNALDAEQVMRDSLRPYNHSAATGFTIHLHTNEDDCHVKAAPTTLNNYDVATLATIGMLTMIVVIVLVTTFRDICGGLRENASETATEKAFMAFSLKRTLRALFKTETSSSEITCVHGIRACCTVMLYLAHKLIPIANTPYSNRIYLTEASNSMWSSVFRGSLIYTDSFLLLSGLLSAYNMSKDMETRHRIDFCGRFFSRFIRLTPALGATVLFYAYIFELIGEGPLWNSVVGTNAELCKNSWWKNILYIQNFFQFEDMCSTHTHQLALDMQLSLLAPILVWALYERPFLGLALVTGLNAVSVGVRFYATTQHQLSLFIYHGMTLTQLYRTANKSYGQSLHRATPYIAGVCLGVLLRQTANKDFRMPKVLAVGGWLAAGYFTGWLLYTPSHQALRNYQYDVMEAAQYSALASVAWALSLSWVIFYCFVEPSSTLNSILGCRPMVVCSRISYAVFLTQFAVFFYDVGMVRTTTPFEIHNSVSALEVGMVFVMSILVTLFLDLPMQDVKAALLDPRKSKKAADVEPIEDVQAENISDEAEDQVDFWSTLQDNDR